MIRQQTRLEHKIGERVYHLFCDNDSPTSEIKDALSQWMGLMVNVEANAKAQAEAAKAEAEKECSKCEEKITPTEEVN